VKKKLSALISALLGLVVYTSCNAVESGQPAPKCEIAALGSSSATDTSRYQGKVVYVDFWASWCPPCLKAFPFLNTLDYDLHDKGLEVIGVNVDENISDANEFLKNHASSFVVGSDTKGVCPKSFGVMGMPSSYLIDRKGIVRLVHIGFRESDREELRHSIEKLLGDNDQISSASNTENLNHHQ